MHIDCLWVQKRITSALPTSTPFTLHDSIEQISHMCNKSYSNKLTINKMHIQLFYTTSKINIKLSIKDQYFIEQWWVHVINIVFIHIFKIQIIYYDYSKSNLFNDNIPIVYKKYIIKYISIFGIIIVTKIKGQNNRLQKDYNTNITKFLLLLWFITKHSIIIIQSFEACI